MISFRIDNTDVEVLQNQFGNEFTAQQLVDLDRYEIVARLWEDGTMFFSYGFRKRKKPC